MCEFGNENAVIQRKYGNSTGAIYGQSASLHFLA